MENVAKVLQDHLYYLLKPQLTLRRFSKSIGDFSWVYNFLRKSCYIAVCYPHKLHNNTLQHTCKTMFFCSILSWQGFITSWRKLESRRWKSQNLHLRVGAEGNLSPLERPSHAIFLLAITWIVRRYRKVQYGEVLIVQCYSCTIMGVWEHDLP